MKLADDFLAEVIHAKGAWGLYISRADHYEAMRAVGHDDKHAQMASFNRFMSPAVDQLPTPNAREILTELHCEKI